jgi:hypothetical protein
VAIGGVIALVNYLRRPKGGGPEGGATATGPTPAGPGAPDATGAWPPGDDDPTRVDPM